MPSPKNSRGLRLLGAIDTCLKGIGVSDWPELRIEEKTIPLAVRDFIRAGRHALSVWPELDNDVLPVRSSKLSIEIV